MRSQSPSRGQAQDAFRLANDIMLDLVTATRAHDTFLLWFQFQEPTEVVRVGVNRLCLFYVCVTLYKWLEWHDRYGSLIPGVSLGVARKLKKQLEKRGLRELRDKYIGHVWDRDTRRPMTTADVDAYVDRIAGPDIPAFFRWLNHPQANPFPETVVSIIERIKNDIQREWRFNDEDVRA